MLRSIKDSLGAKIKATDGDIGELYSLYFDDGSWITRYLVIDTGNWLSGRQVLVSPSVAGQPDWDEHALPVRITRRQVESSPEIGAELPVSRQNESTLVNYFGWPAWWVGFGAPLRPAAPEDNVPPGLTPAEADPDSVIEQAEENDPHLHDMREVIDYRIQASDGDLGHVADFLFDDSDWTLRYLVIDTGALFPGRRVLVGTPWIREVDWADSTVKVDLQIGAIENSPPYDPSRPITREYEAQLHDYYGQKGYWP